MKYVSRLLLVLTVLSVACDEPSAPPHVSIEIDFSEGPEGLEALRRLDDPFSIDETRELREAFDWAETSVLPEADPDGHPALRYAIAYIATEDQRVVLDAVGPHSPLPLFAVERERWAGQVGSFGFFGDGAGLFHFVVLTASTYNTLRELALDGQPPFAALILRDPPVTDVDNGDGSLDYQWLGERGFRMNDDEPRRDPALSDDAGVRTEPIIVELILTILASRDARDGVDDLLGEVTRAGREGTNTVTLVLGSTDPVHAGVSRTWGATRPGEPGAGTPLVLRDVEVLAQMEVGTQRARTNALGVATVDVAVGAAVSFCIRANNFAVQVDEGFEAQHACDFRLARGVTVANAVDGAAITLTVADPVWNIVAQFTDGNDYSRRVMGHTVSHRAGVLVGAYADLFGSFNNNRAFVLCGGYTSALNFRWAVIADLLAAVISDPTGGFTLGIILAKVLSHDVIFPMHGTVAAPATAAWSRVTPSHEFGHFLQCDMMSVLGGDGDFTEGWGDVIDTSLFGGPPGPGTENLFLTEAIADFLAVQVSGGLDQFRLIAPSGFDDGGSFFCDPTLATCLEDNIGGPGQVVALAQLSRFADPFHASVARTTTLLVDAIDGPPRVLPEGVVDQPSPSASWVTTGGVAPLVGSTAFPMTDAMDEGVTLSGAVMPDTFREMSTMGNTLNQRNFLGALARVARRTFTDAQVCEMFALHAPDGMCTSLVTAEDLMATPITPSAPLIVTGAVDMMNTGSWTWTDISSIADGFVIELVRGDGTLTVPRTPRPYARMDAFSRVGLDFDTAFTFRVATVNETATSLFAEHTIHTFAEAVPSAEAIPLPGAAHLSWDPVQATEFTVHDVTGGGDIIVARTSDPEVIIPGLAGGVERTYRIVARNALGLPSAPSAPVSVTPLNPVMMFTADFGDDAHPEAGSAAHPFRTLRAALTRAAEIDADEIILHEGTFTESGPLTISESITMRGGFRLSAGTWSDVGGNTRVTVTGGASVTGCRTESFNAAGRTSSAAIDIAPGATATVFDVDLAGVRGTVPASQCFAVVHASGANFTIERGSVSTTGTTAACAAGIVATGAGAITVRDTTVRGASYAGATIPTGIEAAGIALCDGAALTAELSAIAAIDAPTLTVASSVGALLGVAGEDVDSIQVQRSTIEAIAGTYAWHAAGGRLGGMQVTATGRVLIANAIVRTPHGGDVNRAIDVGSGTSPLASFQLYHVTAAIGEDWSASEAVTLPFEGAVVSMSGDVRNVAMFNNLLAYAGGGVDLMSGTVFTAIDRYRTTADPLGLAIAGNVLSIPRVSGWHLASLTQCAPVAEFGTFFEEGELNSLISHECHDGARSSWVAARNAAFTDAPGAGPRAVVELLDDGYPLDGPRTFVVGEAPATLPLASEIATDVGGLRRETPPGVGAWAPR